MSLATETSTAEEKTVYSVCGLLQFSKHYAGQLIVSVLFLLLAVVPEKLRTLDRGRPWRDSQFASTRLSPSRDMSR